MSFVSYIFNCSNCSTVANNKSIFAKFAHFIEVLGTKLEMTRRAFIQKMYSFSWQFQEKVVNLHPLLKPYDGELSTENLIYSNTKQQKQ